jgi:PE-PPE domain-containing protein
MKVVARSLVMIFVALFAVPALAVTQTISTAVQLLATTAFILGGTQHPLSTVENDFASGYMTQVITNFINPSHTITAGSPQETNGPVTGRVAVIYPAEFFPVFGSTTFDDSVDDGVGNLGSCLELSDDCNFNGDVSGPLPTPAPGDDFAVFGYSQSAVVASLVKQNLIDGIDTTDAPTSFDLAANPMRPNGGILGRGFEGLTIPIIGITFYGATPTNSELNNNNTPEDPTDDFYEYPTVDVAQQYDFLGGDAPARPLNILAMANSIAAYAELHGDVPTHTVGEPGMIDQGSFGDTHYYMIPADTLPILKPLVDAGVPAAALAIPDAILRVWIEDAYVRDQSPGQPVPFQLSPVGNPIGLIGNTLGAIPVGIDDTVEGFTTPGNRPLGTEHAGPFGVGGPDPSASTMTTMDARAAAPTTPEPGTGLAKSKSNETNVAEEDETDSNTTPPARKPDPIGDFVRNSLDFTPNRKPLGDRPAGEGPLKKVFNALTGQRPKPEKADETGDDQKPAAKDQDAA